MISPSGVDAVTSTSAPFPFIPIQLPSSPQPAGASSQTQLPPSQTSVLPPPLPLLHHRLASVYTAAVSFFLFDSDKPLVFQFIIYHTPLSYSPRALCDVTLGTTFSRGGDHKPHVLSGVQT